MKKKNLNAKLNLNKEAISNLNEIKGGDSLSMLKTQCCQPSVEDTYCICAVTMQWACHLTEEKTCYTYGNECCTSGTSKEICC